MPYYACTIDTPLTAPEVAERMRANVRPPAQGWGWRTSSLPDVPLEGEESLGQFNVMRVVRGRNSFRPVIRGRYASNARGGTSVRLTMILHPAVAIFMALFLVVPVADTFGLFGHHAARNDVPAALLWLVFGVIIVVGGFYPEAFRGRRLIEDALAPRPRP